MSKFKNNKIISWFFVFLWMILIFTLSNMTGEVSTKASVGGIEKTITVIADTTNKMNITKKDKNQPKRIEKISKKLNYPLRKYMHVTEYLILTLLLYNAFCKSGIKNKKTLFLCLLICFLYACTDEFHQLVRERTSSFIDVLIDTSGGLIAVLIIKLKDLTPVRIKS